MFFPNIAQGGVSDVGRIFHRMDGRNVEPSSRLHQDQPGLRALLRERFAERFRGVKGHPYEQGFDLRLVPEKLSEPFNWPGPRTVFVNSMSDLFQPEVPDAYIEDVVRVMVAANWHTYQVLTKRSERLRDLLSTKLLFASKHRHIWWGVSVEDKRYGLPR